MQVLLAFGADGNAATRDGRRPLDLASNDATRAALEPGRVARISEAAPQLRTPRPSSGGAGGPRLSFVQAARQSFSRIVRRSHTGSAAPAAVPEGATPATPADREGGGSHQGEGSHRGGARPPRRSCLSASGALQEEPMPPPPATGSSGAESPPPELQLPAQRFAKA